MRFVRAGIEVQRSLERLDGLLVRESFCLRPQDQPAGEVRLGQVGIQIEGFGEGNIGVFLECLCPATAS